MKPSASAIIPVYNEERTIRTVVNVVLKSKIFLQVICINDGSTDRSLKILKSFGRKIILINFKKNRGKGAVLATGIKKAKTDIVVFLDSDLVGLKPHHLKKLVNILVNKKLDGVLGSLDFPEIIFSILSSLVFSPYEEKHDAITGERAYYRKDLLPHINKISKLGYGAEVYLNNIYKHKKMAFVKLHGARQLMKYSKRGWNYIVLLEFLKQAKEMSRELARQKGLLKRYPISKK